MLKCATEDSTGDSASTLALPDGRGGRLLHSKSNPNLSQITPFDNDDNDDDNNIIKEGHNAGGESSLPKDEQKIATDPSAAETGCATKREKRERAQKQKTSGSREKKERPVTPSYKSFVGGDASSSTSPDDAGKPPRPASSSAENDPENQSKNAGNSTPPSVFKSVDIVIEAA